MFWFIFRTIIYLSFFTFIWYGGQFYVVDELNKGLLELTSNTVFVDQNILKNEMNAKQQNGSFTYPFATISQALEVAAENSHSTTIIISEGTYDEKLVLPENATLYGDGSVIISQNPNDPSIKTITTNQNTNLINLTITGGNHTVLIPHNTSLKILNSTISDAGDFGIKMDKKKRDDNFEESADNPVYEFFNKTEQEINNMPLVKINNSIITKNDNQGLYLCDGRVEILNSQVIKNGEEGIDLHPHMHATIKNTNSSANGESGLETEVYDNIVIIENSTFHQNIKNGIAFITSYGLGNITVLNSKITDNQRLGIRCAIHKSKPKKPRSFFKSVITQKDNIIKNNTEANISEPCLTF